MTDHEKLERLKQATIDNFIEKNYDLIKKHFYKQAREMGYSTRQYKSYFDDCKCFVFIGEQTDLDKETSKDNYFIIKQENDLIIAETFSGREYNFI